MKCCTQLGYQAKEESTINILSDKQKTEIINTLLIPSKRITKKTYRGENQTRRKQGGIKSLFK